MSDEHPHERRGAEWRELEPRQRRRQHWPAGMPRQRRRAWRPGRHASRPRLMAGTAIALAAFVLVDVALAIAAWRFAREQRAAVERARAHMARPQPSPSPAGPDGMDLLLALVQQQAMRDQGLNLSVSVQQGTMALQRQGAALRTMKVVPGPPTAAGLPHGVTVPRPRGKRQIARVVDGDFVWWVPRWVFMHRGVVPPDELARSIRGGLGRLALILDDGSLIYSLPARGPLSDRGYVMPGALRAELHDLLAIRDSLRPGLPVYFH